MESVVIDYNTKDPENTEPGTTTDAFAGLRRVPGKFPPLALLILIVEVRPSVPCERI